VARSGSAREQRLLAESRDFLVGMSRPAPAAAALLKTLCDGLALEDAARMSIR
jgi:hypothetical protein